MTRPLDALRFIRRCKHSQTGWNSGDLDVAFQLFSCGLVWDGNLCSKESRAYLVQSGYAVRHEGVTSLTGKGTVAFLLSPAVWRSAIRRWYRCRRNPFVASPDVVRRALR